MLGVRPPIREQLMNDKMDQIADYCDSLDGYKTIFDFQWKSLTESVQIIVKGVGLYFFTLLAIIGAIYNSKISGTELTIIISAITLISILFAPIMLFMAWGIIKGLNDLEVSLRSICPSQFDAIGMAEYFRRGRLAARVGIVCAIIILLIIIGAVVLIQFR